MGSTASVLELAQCIWVDNALNIVISGATGTGKSYLACAFGVAACKLGYSVRYLHSARFLHLLSMARKDGSYLSLLRSLSKNDILIMDDWMRDPIQLSAAQDLLELFDDRFGILPPSLSLKSPSLIGMPDSLILL
ncbi:MAG: hypothetical protein CVU41_19200 [Chloroflexi bacterium HGW-Chloroflexi-3]|nr:MAG: hypothetical protein CVU41_19200 [Chloroflexi bacterium HGW-Chloroflexi-3]